MVNEEMFHITIKACSILKKSPRRCCDLERHCSLSPFWQRQPYKALGNCATLLWEILWKQLTYFLTFSVLYFSAELLCLFSQSIMWVNSPCYIGFTDATKPDNRSPKFSTSAGRLQQSSEAPKLGAFFGCWSPVPEGSLLNYRRVLGATIFLCGALPRIIKGKGGSRNPAQAQATYLVGQSSWWFSCLDICFESSWLKLFHQKCTPWVTFIVLPHFFLTKFCILLHRWILFVCLFVL